MRVRIPLGAIAAARVYTIHLAGVQSRAGRPLLGDKVYYTAVEAR
jgi:hypothetical protein